MEDVDIVKEVIEGYTELKEIDNGDLYIDMQLGFDHEEENYVIEYGLKDLSIPDEEGIVPELKYDSLEAAWNEYLEQFPEIHQSFPEARKLLMHPREYNSAPLGGNPAERILDSRNNT
ncbi:MAG: hypothetical protein ACI9LV_000029 [Candidatus Nanohaloarchaea archaeon]|jgi:hypothetical protein